MAVGLASRQRTASGPVAQPAPAKQTYFDRWLKTWVILLGAVILVVVVYLIVITNSLASINKNLGVASASVTGAGGNVLTLPDQIQRANGNLTGIDGALKPIDGNAGQIIAALTSIRGELTSVDGSLKSTNGSLMDTNGSLTDTDGSLKDTNGSLGNTDGSLKDTDGSLKNTNGSLGNTSGSLVNTSGTLSSVLRLAGGIRTTLVDADDPPDAFGVQNISERVRFANGVLAPARADTANIVGGLGNVNGNLTGICNSAAVRAGGAPPCP